MDGRLFLAGSCKAGQGWVDNGCGDVPLCLTNCCFVLSMVGLSLEPAW